MCSDGTGGSHLLGGLLKKSNINNNNNNNNNNSPAVIMQDEVNHQCRSNIIILFVILSVSLSVCSLIT